MAAELRFPVLKDVEYIDLIKNKEAKLTIDGKTVEGKTWREFQKYLGTKLPERTYNYVIKIKNDNKIYKGLVRTVGIMKNEDKKGQDGLVIIQSEIKELNEKIGSMSSGNGISVDTLISITKSSYETQLKFLGMEGDRREAVIVKLETQLDDADKELGKCDTLIVDLKEKTGLTQYVTIIKEFLTMRAGSMQAVSLKDSDVKDVPAQIIEVLGVVDWSQVPDEVLKDITDTLRVFIQKLPLKGK